MILSFAIIRHCFYIVCINKSHLAFTGLTKLHRYNPVELKIMKTLKLISGGSALLFMCFSCSTVAYIQKDDGINLSGTKNYMWIDTRADETDIAKKATSYADVSIHTSLNAELTKRGWIEVTENPDLLISYDILMENTVKTQKELLYSRPFTRSYYNPSGKKWSTIYYPSQFQGYEIYETPVKSGTVTITIVDAKTDKNVFQGWTVENLQNSGISNENIKKSILAILKQIS